MHVFSSELGCRFLGASAKLLPPPHPFAVCHRSCEGGSIHISGNYYIRDPLVALYSVVGIMVNVYAFFKVWPLRGVQGGVCHALTCIVSCALFISSLLSRSLLPGPSIASTSTRGLALVVELSWNCAWAISLLIIALQDSSLTLLSGIPKPLFNEEHDGDSNAAEASGGIAYYRSASGDDDHYASLSLPHNAVGAFDIALGPSGDSDDAIVYDPTPRKRSRRENNNNNNNNNNNDKSTKPGCCLSLFHGCVGGFASDTSGVKLFAFVAGSLIMLIWVSLSWSYGSVDGVVLGFAGGTSLTLLAFFMLEFRAVLKSWKRRGGGANGNADDAVGMLTGDDDEDAIKSELRRADAFRWLCAAWMALSAGFVCQFNTAGICDAMGPVFKGISWWYLGVLVASVTTTVHFYKSRDMSVSEIHHAKNDVGVRKSLRFNAPQRKKGNATDITPLLM